MLCFHMSPTTPRYDGSHGVVLLAMTTLATMANGFGPLIMTNPKFEKSSHHSRLYSASCSRSSSSSMPKESSSLDFYEVLGVNPRADVKQIKGAYRKLVKMYHPDANPQEKNKTPQGSEKFMEISRAYQILSDPTLRIRYDKFGEMGLRLDEMAFRYPHDVRDSDSAPRSSPSSSSQRRKRYMFDESTPPSSAGQSEYGEWSAFYTSGKDGLPRTSPESDIDFLYIGQQDYLARDPSISRLDSTACQFQDMLRAKSSSSSHRQGNFESMGMQALDHNLAMETSSTGQPNSDGYDIYDYVEDDDEEDTMPYLPRYPRQQPSTDVRFRLYEPRYQQSVKRSTTVTTETQPTESSHPWTTAASSFHYNNDVESSNVWEQQQTSWEQQTSFVAPPMQAGYGHSLFSQTTTTTPVIQRRSTELPKRQVGPYTSYSP